MITTVTTAMSNRLSRRTGRPGRRTLGFALAAAAYTALRAPSLLEPHWYTDEAGYLTTAREMLLGKVLYLQIWSNKPPVLLWTVAAALRMFGSSEIALHAVTWAFGLTALAAAAYAAFHLLTFRTAMLATLAVAVLIGTPLLDAELMVPESLLIAPASWAGAIVLVRLHSGSADRDWWPIAAGVLVGVATAYQQTAAADAAALLAILLVSPQVSARRVLTYVMAYVTVTAAWLIPSVALAGPDRVMYALAGFYVPYTTFQLHGDPSLGVGIVAVIAIAAALVIGAAISARKQRWLWAAGIWSVATLLAAGAPLHSYAHLALPAAVPAVLVTFGLLERGRANIAVPGLRWSSAGLVAALLLATSVASTAGVDWMPPLSGQDSNQSHTLTSYYGGFAAVVAGSSSVAAWRSGFDDRVDADRAVAMWLRDNGLAGAKAVVWSSDAWLYVLADLDDILPTPPIYNDFALLGYDGQVTAYVAMQKPDVIITEDDDLASFPEIATLLSRHYAQAFTAGQNRVWIRVSRSRPEGKG